MNKRNKIIVSIVGITIVLLALLGITYAYYLTRIEGNTNTNSISITTADLSLTYGDGTTEILTSDKLLMPGEFEGTKDFTVTNNGNASVTYGVILEDMINQLTRPQDMKMTLSCSSSNVDGGCSGLDEMNLPSTNEFLVENTIEVGETHTYELKLRYIEAGVDQSIDMGKTISGKVNIIDSHDTVDMTGVVANYEEGDYVQVNSEPKISYITKDGKYKVVGLKPEQHTIAVYKKDGTLKGDKELTIKSGTIESISENEITVTKDTRTIRMNVTAINSDNTITTGSTSLDKYNPFKSGTLAYEILNNANNVTEEEMISGVAQYVDKPLSQIGNEQTAYKYLDDGINTTEKTSNLFSEEVGNSERYYVYADNYIFEEICYEYEDEDGNYDECYYSDPYFILKNDDGSDVVPVKGYSDLAGKYIIDVGGYSTNTSYSTEYYYIYYVVEVVDNIIYYVSVNENGPVYNYDRYYKYGDSYKFDDITGKYTIYNSDGSSLKSIKYKDGYDAILVDKYIYSAYGSDNNSYNYSPASSIYKVSSNSTLKHLYYYQTSNHKYGIENIISYDFDDFGTTYYYRGGVKNNYLNFAGMCWKITRIEGDGSIKLLLQDKTAECDSNLYVNDYLVGSGPYGFELFDGINNINYFASGYMSSSFYDFQSVLEESLNTNDLSDFLRYGKWCYDNSVYVDSKGSAEIDDIDSYSASFAYSGSSVRFYSKMNPSLKCRSLTKPIDTMEQFLDGTNMYVATLTLDELFFAGLDNVYSSIPHNFLSADTTNKRWWVLTPHSYSNSTHWGSCYDYAYCFGGNVSVQSFPVNMDGDNTRASYRPSIVLKTDTLYVSGDGSKSNPYVVG